MMTCSKCGSVELKDYVCDECAAPRCTEQQLVGPCQKCGKSDELATENRVGSGGDWWVTDCMRCGCEVHAVRDRGQPMPIPRPNTNVEAPK
jgi:hypothetical protein